MSYFAAAGQAALLAAGCAASLMAGQAITAGNVAGPAEATALSRKPAPVCVLGEPARASIISVTLSCGRS